jgi:hypothetical protein
MTKTTPKPRNSKVLVAAKTPMMPQPTTAYLDGRLTLRQSLRELQQIPPKDAVAQRVVQQLARETSGPHDYLVVTEAGALAKADPEKTVLEEVAIPREVRTARGIENVPTVAYEIQAYAPVGVVERSNYPIDPAV